MADEEVTYNASEKGDMTLSSPPMLSSAVLRESESFAQSDTFDASTPKLHPPLFASTSTSNFKPSHSLGGMTQISMGQQSDIDGYGSSSPREYVYSPSQRELPYGDSQRELTYGDSQREFPHGNSQRELPYGDSQRQIEYNNSPRDQKFDGSDSTPQNQVPYYWMEMNDVKEMDDDLHDPNLNPPTRGAPQRAILNVGALVLLILAMLMLFAGYPILHHYTEMHQQDDRTAMIASHLKNNRQPNIPAGVPAGRANSTQYKGSPDADLRTLIDPDTPADAYQLESTYSKGLDAEGNPKKFQLVFSDEFNTAGRSFYPGEDPFWEAVDLHYWATGNYEWYDPAAVYTKDGGLHIRLEQHEEHNLNFRGGMLQSWNKFCFTGGILIASVQMPGSPKVGGLWPAFWLMGNLGRAGYGATLQGTWPYSYDQCDVGTVKNQTLYNTDHPEGFPVDTLNGGATMFNQKHHTRALSFLPGQKLSACTCHGEDHPGPWLEKENRYRGRAAPEIDVFEGQAGDKATMSQSLQMAPYNWLYEIDYHNETEIYSFYNNHDGHINMYTGEITQQSLSGINDASQTAVQQIAEDQNPATAGADAFATYSLEYAPGPSGYAAWTSDGKPAWELYEGALRADPRSNVSARQFPAEPMYIIFNLGMSSNFGGIEWDKLNKLWPFEMVIDWVRVYQDPEAINIGCDTPDYPTKDYIEKHIEAYTNSNLTLWGNTPEEGGYGADWPLNRLYSKECKGTRSTQPGDADQPSAVAPNIASSSVTIGIYSTRDGQDPLITKHTPIPGAPGAVPPSSAPAPTATATA